MVQSISAIRADQEFFGTLAQNVLGGSDVATVTADRLRRQEIEVDRIRRALITANHEFTICGYRFKLIEADPETPANFGLLIRRIPTDTPKR
jgi:hypothetical protein